MRQQRRVVAVLVVSTVAAIAACLGPSLSSTEQAAVVVQPGSGVNFGSVALGGSASQAITFTPASGSGSSSDQITGVSFSCTQFSVMSPPLPATVSRICATEPGSDVQEAATAEAEAECTETTAEFLATFAPTLAGSASCLITFTGTFGSVPVQLSGTGAAPALAIEVTPSSINFGDVRVGDTSGFQPILIRNAGSSSLTISGVTHAPTAGFALSGNTAAHSLGAGSSESVLVTCTPVAAGSASSTVTISSNAANQPTASVGLSCRGITSALAVSPSPANLGTRVRVPVEKTITIQNTGSATSSIEALTLIGGNAELSLVAPTPTPPLVLQPNSGSGSTTSVRVRYAADTAQATAELGKLRITHDGGQTREVNLNGEALIATLGLNPDGIDFGPVCANAPASQPLTVFASSPGHFVLTSIDAPAAPFGFAASAGTAVPSSALGNHGNDLEFTVSLQSAQVGLLEDKVVLHTDAPEIGAREVGLRAEVLAAGIGATPGVVDFGSVIPHTTTPAKASRLTNCGAAPLAISSARIEGPNAADFTLVSPSPAAIATVLEPTDSLELLVVMRSTTAGGKTATLVVEHGTGTTQIDLVGTSAGTGGGDGDGRITYYECSTGGGGDPWLIGLAVLALRRRRRRHR